MKICFSKHVQLDWSYPYSCSSDKRVTAALSAKPLKHSSPFKMLNTTHNFLTFVNTTAIACHHNPEALVDFLPVYNSSRVYKRQKIKSSLFEYLGTKLCGKSLFHHGHAEHCRFCPILNTNLQHFLNVEFSYHGSLNKIVFNIVNGPKCFSGLGDRILGT